MSGSGTAAAPEGPMPDKEQEFSSSSGQQSDSGPGPAPDPFFRTDTASSATAQLAQRLAQQSLLAEVSLLGGSHSSRGEAEDGGPRAGSPSLTAILQAGAVGLEQDLGEGCWGEMIAGAEEAEQQCQLQPEGWDDIMEQQAGGEPPQLPAALGPSPWEVPSSAGTAGQGAVGGGGVSLPGPSVAHWLAMEEDEQQVGDPGQCDVLKREFVCNWTCCGIGSSCKRHPHLTLLLVQEVAAAVASRDGTEETCSLAAGLAMARPYPSTATGPISSAHYCSPGGTINTTMPASPFGSAAMSYLAAAASVLAAAKAAEASAVSAAPTSRTAVSAAAAGSRHEAVLPLPTEPCSVRAPCKATAGEPEPQSRPSLTGTPIVAMPVQQQHQQQAQQQAQQWPCIGPTPGFYMDAGGIIRLGIPTAPTAGSS